jgi:hypothetical protein
MGNYSLCQEKISEEQWTEKRLLRKVSGNLCKIYTQRQYRNNALPRALASFATTPLTKSLFGNLERKEAIAVLKANETTSQMQEGFIGKIQLLPTHQ